MLEIVRREYVESWREYRRLRACVVAIVVGGGAVCALLGWLGLRYLHSRIPAFLVAVHWSVITVLFGVVINRWPCPRCGASFAGHGWTRMMLFARKCRRCGLQKYATHD